MTHGTQYIGVTGFMTREEVAAAVRALDSLPDVLAKYRHLMVGVLVSSKTLAGNTNKYPNRYPKVQDIAELFPPHRRTVNLIHYATDDPKTLDEQVKELIKLGGPNLDGFQLNMSWPEPDLLIPLTEKRVVLQLGRQALEEMGNDPERVARKAADYRGVITDVLIDASAGRGLPLDVVMASGYVRAMRKHCRILGVGVAGGLSHENLGQLSELVRIYQFLNIDAEGRLRKEDDRLNVEAVQDYIRAADKLFG